MEGFTGTEEVIGTGSGPEERGDKVQPGGSKKWS